MKLLKRELYLSKLRKFYNDTGLIKVLTGIRRSGKSCIMLSIMDELREQGVPESNLVSLNLDSLSHKDIKTPQQLAALIGKHAHAKGIKYLFIDEVQNVANFEPLINAYREEGDWSIFITGSNSYLFSGELVTKLTGRYLAFEVYTLTFAEYVAMKELLKKPINADVSQEFASYLQEGGFPKAVEYDDLRSKRAYTEGVIHEIIEKDIRSYRKIRNVSVFNRVIDYLIGNFGAPTSISNLLKHFNANEGLSIKRETLNRYIQILVDAKVLYECKRFDIKSKVALKGEQKYYLADLSIYYALSPDNRINYGPTLENVTYLYAQSKGYKASVGKIGKLECDFILRDWQGDYAYVQVAQTIAAEKTEEREYRSLEAIHDAYPKYLLTMDPLLQRRNGVVHANIAQFMRNKEDF